MRKLILSAAFAATLLGAPALAAGYPQFAMNFIAGYRDAAGHFMGGTEMRAIVPHVIPYGGAGCATVGGCPVMFAFNGLWEDVPGPENYQCAQALILTKPEYMGGAWAQDWNFGDSEGAACPFSSTTPLGVALATASAFEKTFTTYGNGSPTAGSGIAEVIVGLWSMMYCGGTGTPAVVANRIDATGQWAWTQLACDNAGSQILSQVRSFGSHKDNVTGVDMAFAGENPRGIYNGVLNSNGTIAWSTNPEPMTDCPGLSPPLYVEDCTNVVYPGNGHANAQWPSGVALPSNLAVRVMGLTEATNASGVKNLYALIGMQIWRRVDGVNPTWTLFWELPGADMPVSSASGLRGLTAVPNPNGAGQSLLLGEESEGPAIWRVNINGTGCTSSTNTCGTIEQEMIGLTNAKFGCSPPCTGYQIPAYNSPLLAVNGGIVTGQGTIFYDPGVTPPAGHSVWSLNVPGIITGNIDSAAWYSFRSAAGAYTMYGIPAIAPQHMISTRSCAISPWLAAGDDAIYCGGFDANNTPGHNTAWIARAPLSVFLP